MLEVGWSEILVIALILIIVVGPKDLPQMLRTFGRMATRMRGMANEFKGQFDEAMREADLDDVRKGLGEVQKLNPANTLRDAMNPLRKLGEDIKSDLKKASDMTAADGNTPATETTADPVATPAIAPIADPLVPSAIEKTPETAPVAPPLVSTAAETPVAKPKASRKKAAEPATLSEAALEAPAAKKSRNAPVADAATADAVTDVTRKPSTRKKPVATENSPAVADADVAAKKAAPRNKTEKTGDA